MQKNCNKQGVPPALTMRGILLWMLLMLLGGGVWAADYVLAYVKGTTTYYLARNGTSGVERVTTFNPTTCIWSCENSSGSASTLNNSTTYGWLYQTVSGTKHYLKHGGTVGLTTTKSTNTGNWTYNTTCWRTDGTYVYNNYQTYNATTYFINLNNGVGSRTSSNNQCARPYEVTTTRKDAVITAPSISCSGLSGSTGLQMARTESSNYTPAYTNYLFNNLNHYFDASGSSISSIPTPSSDGITYTWTNATDGVATISAAGNLTVTLQASKNGTSNNSTYTFNATQVAESQSVVAADIAITPAYSSLDLGQTSTYSVPSNNTQYTQTTLAHLRITGNSNQDGPWYKTGSTYSTTPQTQNSDPTPATLNGVSWSFSGGTGFFSTSENGNPITLTRNTTRTRSDQTFTITANATYGSAVASATAQVTIPLTLQVATPEITFTPITNTQRATATISCATSGVNIYYTVNGGTPTSSSTQYTAGFTVNADDVVRAIAVKTGTNASSYDNSDMAEATFNLEKVPTPEIIVCGYDVRFRDAMQNVTYYYTTDGSDPTTSSTRNTSGTITLPTSTANNTTIKVMAVKTGYSNSEITSKVYHTAHVVYLRLAGAQGNQSGSSAANAVGTWANAFKQLGYGPNAKYLYSQWKKNGILAAVNKDSNSTGLKWSADFTSTVDNNIIYLVGDVTEAQFSPLMTKTITDPGSESALMQPIVSSGFFKPVTISGKYANSGSNTMKYARININGGSNYYLNEDMRFEFVEFRGNGANSVNFLLAYYDLEMGDSIITSNFYPTASFSTYHHGYKQGVTNTAHILFYGGHRCDKRFGISTNGALNFDYYLPHPDGYKITIRSGFFSTISPGGTQWDNSGSLNGTMGSPNTPVKCTITVDIDRAWNDRWKSGVLNSGTPNCDIAVVIAGTHEGNMYGDVDIIVKSGRIDRVVNGTFGANNFVTNHPADSYFGRANILIDPREPKSTELSTYRTKNSLVQIRELYGGGLGRFKSSSTKTNQSSTYFYGKSTVVINGGTFETALYASGAGGVNGVGDDNHNTPDQLIPYWNGTTLAYGTYSAHKDAINKFYVVCRNSSATDDTTHVYISKTSAKIEIHGGVFGTQTVKANIYGGGYGFVDAELIDYANSCKPNTRAGAIFAAAGQQASSITIDGDAVIYGNVYGAGRGDDTYKKANITYNSDNYTQLGQVYGNTALSIGGNAKIYGSVFGAGEGIDGYDNMARHFGNTTVTIGDNAEITGGVYGGGKNGSIGCTSSHTNENGNVTVTITGKAKIGTSTTAANVHGGGLGKSTRVLGNVKVNIGTRKSNGAVDGDAVIYGDVYGGSAEGKTNGNTARTNSSTTTVTLNSGTISGALYGGGLGTDANPADVYGPVQVDVYGGTLNTTSVSGSGCVFGCNNVKGAPQNTVQVDVYSAQKIENVYGGGNQAAYTAPSNNGPTVNIHNGTVNNNVFGGGLGKSASVTGYPVVTIGDDGSASSNPLIRGEVYGGGDAAPTTGDPVVNMSKGNVISCVYGGGKGADAKVTGSTEVNISGTADVDCYVFGGGNAATTTSNTTVNITGGRVGDRISELASPTPAGSIYGGGRGSSATVTGNTTVNISNGANVMYNVFGGGSDAPTNGNASVIMSSGTVQKNIFGGGEGATAKTKDTTVKVTGTTTKVGESVYGGGLGAEVTGSTNVTIGDE